MKNETFKDIIGYEGLYQISNYGNVKNTKTGRILKPSKTIKGYFNIGLRKNNTPKSFRLHRLVALHFIPNIENKEQINHINGIKTDNRVENLEWCNNSENQYHSNWVLGNKIKSVIQMDLDGNVINIYNSLLNASKQTNINFRSISLVCLSKRKTAGGYKWDYAT